MNESQFIAQTKTLRRLWGFMIEERYGAKGPEILDGILDEWWNEFKGLDLDTFEACVAHVRKTFQPSYNEPFPAPKRIWEAQAAISQEVAKVEPVTDLEQDPKFQEYERLLEEIRHLPPEKYSALVAAVKPRVKEKLPKADKDVVDICERALWPGEMVRAYCEQTGIECPI